MNDGRIEALTPDEFLEHYGVRGMKWGVRKARTGVLGSRASQAERVGSGKASRSDKLVYGITEYGVNDLVKGRSISKAAARKAEVFNAERKRLATGKATTKDLLKAYGTASIITLAASMHDSKKNNTGNRSV